ncbi:FUSC family protein [Amycolatopsis sp. PS_44_ISF1]|uniref:FUSC family protein n=1 Tax=Amycolatopsis sp. PS_44_ISF1 TaxID=2974917 RepID=UPI0028DD6760|nr:FUSC family protein [Amycolatopsis sp. PS_44_ISF1]MDT8914931.1 FUSC family protein [Amycolatopsis sp. PS_44_ISF1]
MNALARGGGMLAVVLVVVGGTAGLGAALGLGGTTILAGLIALFCFIAANGGPLRPDLRLLAGFAPAVVAGAAGPRLLGGVSVVAAVALLVLVVFVSALLPALGARFVTVGLGLGLASVFGYGFQLTGSAGAAQIIGAPALAVAVVFVLRLLMGLGDPGRPTRAALADALAGPDPLSAERAVRLWLADRPRAWQARVLGAGLRAHGTSEVLRDRLRALEPEPAEALTAVLSAADGELARIAAAVREKHPPAELAPVARVGVDHELPGETRRLVEDLWSAIEAVRAAAAVRDESIVDFPRRLVEAAVRHEAAGALSWRSAQLRHAVRCALGMLVAIIVASLRPGDPLTVSFLMTTYAIMQPEWRDTLSKAWQRCAGAVAGAVVLALVLWLLPPSALLPAGVVALLAGLPFMQAKPMVFNGCMVLMSVGVNAATHRLDAVSVLVEYLLLVLLAVVIGLLFGFAAVPGVPKPPVSRRFAEATEAMGELLTAVAARLRGEAPERRELGLRFRAAVRTHQDLLNPEAGSRNPDEAQREALDEAAGGLRGLAASAGAMLQGGSAGLAAFAEGAARALADGTAVPSLPEPADDEQRLIADLLLTDVLRVQHARPALAAG